MKAFHTLLISGISALLCTFSFTASAQEFRGVNLRPLLLPSSSSSDSAPSRSQPEPTLPMSSSSVSSSISSNQDLSQYCNEIAAFSKKNWTLIVSDAKSLPYSQVGDLLAKASAICNSLLTDYNDLPASTSLPSITGYTPASGKAGSSVTIFGSNLSNVTKVTIGNKHAVIKSQTKTSIVVTLSPHVTSGKISLVNSAGRSTSTTNFTVLK